jgi:hypothetical protein
VDAFPIEFGRACFPWYPAGQFFPELFRAQPRQQQGREEEKNLEKKGSILAGAPPEHFLSPFLSELGLTMKQS